MANKRPGSGMDNVLQAWPVLGAGAAFVAWLVRLEAKSLENEREIARLWTQRKDDLAAAKESREAMTKTLDEIRSDIKALDEIRSDIKALLLRRRMEQ